jgi:L-aspartate oxidase
MTRVHPDAELAPRDIVARAVFAEIAAGRKAFLDARTAIGSAFSEKFPSVFATCNAAGFDPARDLIPVAPAEHYHMGGIAVDAQGRTSLPGLWAAGEVASTGLHGANRLASNSLLEAVVFGARVAADINATSPVSTRLASESTDGAGQTVSPSPELRALMSNNVGVVRNEAGLARALTIVAEMDSSAVTASEKNIAAASLLIAAAAYYRQESRGAHFRQDFPATDPEQARRTMITLKLARQIAAEVAEDRQLTATVH